jgi:hypothetical protein
MWYPSKAAFRAGHVNSTNWDKDSVGLYSTAFGNDSKAIGDYSTAMGHGSIASGSSSTAMGFSAIASQYGATAMGYVTTASGYGSTSMGYQTAASGFSSTAMGALTNAKSSYETVVGRYNTDYTPTDVYFWNATDRLFTIGNGGDFYEKSDAMTVLKNGNTGFGTSTPSARLHIKHNSFPEPSLLIEESENDYTRMEFRNTNANSFWQMNAKPQTTTASAQLEFWNNSAGVVTTPLIIYGTGNATLIGVLTQPSDERLKRNMVPVKDALQKLTQLNGYNYYWKNENADQSLQTGVMAQEVQKLFPMLVKEDNKGMLSVNYNGLIPVMIESIKEQQQQIDELKKLVHQLMKN